MCEELTLELETGNRACEELVDHIVRMGADSVESPVMRADKNRELVEWTITVRKSGEAPTQS
jgi:hypothetical protein